MIVYIHLKPAICLVTLSNSGWILAVPAKVVYPKSRELEANCEQDELYVIALE